MRELPMHLQQGLVVLVEDLTLARNRLQLDRLALLCYCDVRRWARMAGENGLALQTLSLFTDRISRSRHDFLNQVDAVVAELNAIAAGRHDGSGTSRMDGQVAAGRHTGG